MIPKHLQKNFKIEVAAYVKLEHEKRGTSLIDSLLDTHHAFSKNKDVDTEILGENGLFASDDAFYQFCYQHTDEISVRLDELRGNSTESPFSQFSPPIYEGGTFLGGGSQRGEARLSSTDEASERHVVNRENLDYILRTLTAMLPNEEQKHLANIARVIASGIT